MVWSPPNPHLNADPRARIPPKSGPKRAEFLRFFGPCGATLWGGGGAPPTTLILLRNQRSSAPACRDDAPARTARAARGAGGAWGWGVGGGEGVVGVGGVVSRWCARARASPRGSGATRERNHQGRWGRRAPCSASGAILPTLPWPRPPYRFRPLALRAPRHSPLGGGWAPTPGAHPGPCRCALRLPQTPGPLTRGTAGRADRPLFGILDSHLMCPGPRTGTRVRKSCP